MARFDRLAAMAVLATDLLTGATITVDGFAQPSLIALDQVIMPYAYRDRSRSLERARKWGNSRDERGEESQRSSNRSGFGAEDDVESIPNESHNVDREEEAPEKGDED